MELESVKIETEVLNRIRPHVKEKGLILSKFISMELAKVMDNQLLKFANNENMDKRTRLQLTMEQTLTQRPTIQQATKHWQPLSYQKASIFLHSTSFSRLTAHGFISILTKEELFSKMQGFIHRLLLTLFPIRSERFIQL